VDVEGLGAECITASFFDVEKDLTSRASEEITSILLDVPMLWGTYSQVQEMWVAGLEGVSSSCRRRSMMLMERGGLLKILGCSHSPLPCAR
jgi:hypothetical protein